MTDTEKEHPDFGRLSAHSENQVNDHISYHEGNHTYTGTIIWVTAASTIGTKRILPHYVVERDDAPNSFPDIVFFGDICIS